ncbi:L-serine ammonia-lyase, iron-sulfur-dependent, subunit alpha [Hippea alviniae]|uniref:L-serine ammonia-lyase, iron-sulfur-dependent, subunit alpha n=1 Tax=Hippea alviniae TaxID=1279027 RepID=UPI0003B725E4|nr:L-serine ammonia-lyase, iron-sulfur-dependent, subunit alpha [Hippea alviniae]
MELKEKMLKMIEFSLGCTEPAAIALNCAYLSEQLKDADKIEIEIDRMTFKNAFGAGIPNSGGLTGTKWAALLGYFISDTSKELEIFSLLSKEVVKKAKETKIKIDIRLSDKKQLFIRSKANKGNEYAEVITRRTHTGISQITKNGKIILKKKASKVEEEIEFEEALYNYKNWEKIVNKLYEDKEIKEKIKKAVDVNMKAAEYAKKYSSNNRLFGAVYARMGGDSIEVASCAGSGNKGLTAIIPVVSFGRSLKKEEKEIQKASLLSCFITSIVTSKFGFVSSECGVVHAAGVGIIGGILYLKGKMGLFFDAFKNYIQGVAGVFCDGAKKGCSSKALLAEDMALKSIELAEEGIVQSEKDGFLGRNFYETINNLFKYDPYFKLFDRETIEILSNKN